MKKGIFMLVLLLLLLCLPACQAWAELPAGAGAPQQDFLAGAVTISPRSYVEIIKDDGSLWHTSWDGTFDNKEASPWQQIAPEAQAVINQDWLSMYLDYNYTLWAHGSNVSSNLGLPAEADQTSRPMTVLEAVVSFDLGSDYGLAVRTDSSLWFWGMPTGFTSTVTQDDDGAYLSWSARTEYTPVQLMTDVRSISAQAAYGLAVKIDDSLWTWVAAWDEVAEKWLYTPHRVMENIARVEAGLAIDKDGTLWGFTADPQASTPLTPYQLLENVSQVKCPGQNYLALDAEHNLWVWPNANYDRGEETAATPQPQPQKIAGDCGYIVGVWDYAPSYHVLYINTKNELHTFDLGTSYNARSQTKQLASDVLYATVSGDGIILYVKPDGSLWSLRLTEGGATRAEEDLAGLMLNAPQLDPPPGVQPDTPAPAPQFSDTDGHWAKAAIARWAERGIVQGNGGFFRPDAQISRAEFAAILNRLINRPIAYASLEVQEGLNFRDTPAEAWYYDDMMQLYLLGIFQGDGNNSLRPLAPLTRQEAVTLLARTFHVESAAGGHAKYNDTAEIAGWAGEHVAAMQAGDYLGGLAYQTGAATFSPQAKIMRAEVVSILDKLVGTYYNQAGEYGGEKITVLTGNVLISANSITLKNLTIHGNVYLTAGIGRANTKIKFVDCTIEGSIYADCDTLSISLYNTTAEHLDMRQTTFAGAMGSTAVRRTTAYSYAILNGDQLDSSAPGFPHIVIPAASTWPELHLGSLTVSRLENYYPEAVVFSYGRLQELLLYADLIIKGDPTLSTSSGPGSYVLEE